MITSCWHITGTSRGLGKAIAETLLAQEDTLVYGYARKQTITHERYVHQHIDLSDTASIKNIAFPNAESYQKIILINNAATLGEIVFTGDLNFDQLAASYHVNVLAVHALTNAFIQTYKQAVAKKVIINITSGAAQHAYAGWSIYCSSKAAIDMLTRCVREEMTDAAHPIFAYAIAPGIMDTEMQATIRNADAMHFPRKQKFIELHETGKLLPVEAVAQAYIQFVHQCNGTEEPIQKISL